MSRSVRSSLLCFALTLAIECLFLPRSGEASEDVGQDLVYIAGAVVGAFPVDHDAVFQDAARDPTAIRSGIGLALKAAVFPAVLRRIVGLELESMGHSGSMQFPLSSEAGARSGNSSLTVFTTMANLLVQYPGWGLTPYGGVGLGWATGVLTDTDIPGRPDRGLEGSSAFSYQFLAGVRAHLGERAFIFTEYKHVTAQFHWTQLALQYEANYALVGLGYSF